MVGIARERMDLLMDQATKAMHMGDVVKANRYAGLARGIGMRYNVRMRLEHRQMVCRKCSALMIPSKTSTIRIVRGRRIVRCLKCGDIRRIPIKARTSLGSSTVRPRPVAEEAVDEKEKKGTDEDMNNDDTD
jgi:ribonuclease P protein subunit RPR2